MNSQAGSGEPQLRPLGGTKMEQEILEKVLVKHKQHIVKKQIAGGREFKGQPFYSKPDIIHFKVTFSIKFFYVLVFRYVIGLCFL